MNSKYLNASITVEAAYIFPLVCAIFAMIISLCFYLHDKVTLSAASYVTILSESYNNRYHHDEETSFSVTTEDILTITDSVTLKNNHIEPTLSKDKKSTLTLHINSDITNFKISCKSYSYSSNLRLFKAVNEYIGH